MNAPLPSSRRPVASPPTDSAAHATALVPVALDIHNAANGDTEPISDNERNGLFSIVNPLWMITAALALLLAVMAILISS